MFPAMTKSRKGKNERRFTTAGSTQRNVGQEARLAVFGTLINPNVVNIFLILQISIIALQFLELIFLTNVLH